MSVLERMLQLEPINFRYKEVIKPKQLLRAGLSAQLVKQLLPDAVIQINGLLVINQDILQKYITQVFHEARINSDEDNNLEQ